MSRKGVENVKQVAVFNYQKTHPISIINNKHLGQLIIVSEWENQETAIYEDEKFERVRAVSIVNHITHLDATFLI